MGVDKAHELNSSYGDFKKWLRVWEIYMYEIAFVQNLLINRQYFKKKHYLYSETHCV